MEQSLKLLATKKYESWLEDSNIDADTKRELLSINENEIVDRFYRELTFGTGGLRGVMGAGTNRMNSYTVGKATQGLANWLMANQQSNLSAVIAHDSRHNSPQFALDTALVLAANGIKAYLFHSLRPTPQLSFAVRHLQASLGVVITASHNPPEYNGFKAYDQTGCQLIPEDAEAVIAEISKISSFTAVKKISKEEAEQAGLLVWLDEQVDDAFVDAVVSQSLNRTLIKQSVGETFKIVFTPLHGAGNVPVRRALQEIGFKNVYIVKEQEQPDGEFPTVSSPNPEEKDAFKLAIELAKEVDAHIVVGTDPDADRMGALVRNQDGSYEVLTGNQAGAIMLHYVLSQKQANGSLPSNGTVIKTIVTSELGAVVAKSFGLEVENTLTGFKYIGEKMNKYEKSGEKTFIFGYEESYGYLTGQYARDKDAIVAAMLICEAAAYYSTQNKTLNDVLNELYVQHGYYIESQQSRTLKGVEGVQKIATIMEQFRQSPPTEIAGKKVSSVLDYNQKIEDLRPENVLKYQLEDGSWFCLRPSGTEPKIKIYFSVKGHSLEQAKDTINEVTHAVMTRVDQI